MGLSTLVPQSSQVQTQLLLESPYVIAASPGSWVEWTELDYIACRTTRPLARPRYCLVRPLLAKQLEK